VIARFLESANFVSSPAANAQLILLPRMEFDAKLNLDSMSDSWQADELKMACDCALHCWCVLA